jgi:RNA polymerase sigma-70 factor (ECF subfamily)
VRKIKPPGPADLENGLKVDPVTVGNSQSGADLVERIRSGDRQAEEELFLRYRRGVCIILQHRGISLDVSEDLFQETMMIVLIKIRAGDIREPDRLSGFVHAVANNLRIMHFRRESNMSQEPEVGIDTVCPPEQHEQLSKKEEARIVRQIIGELKIPRDRQILIRYCLGEEEKETICKDLALSSAHFDRVLYRALQRFKALYTKRTVLS